MENMDKGLTVPKWVLIVQPKIPQMPQNLSAQFVCPSPKFLDFKEKRIHWASIVHGQGQCTKQKSKNPTIFNIIRWVAGTIISVTKRLIIQASQPLFYFQSIEILLGPSDAWSMRLPGVSY